MSVVLVETYSQLPWSSLLLRATTGAGITLTDVLAENAKSLLVFGSA